MAPIMAQGGAILARPTGGILATDCGSTLCSPCIETPQDNAGLSVTGGSCQIEPEFWPPGNLYWCENWPGGYWAGTCCWVWANHTNLDPPGFIFHYVLIVCYSAGQFDARIWVGTNIVDDEGSHDPCDWDVSADPPRLRRRRRRPGLRPGRQAARHLHHDRPRLPLGRLRRHRLHGDGNVMSRREDHPPESAISPDPSPAGLDPNIPPGSSNHLQKLHTATAQLPTPARYLGPTAFFTSRELLSDKELPRPPVRIDISASKTSPARQHLRSPSTAPQRARSSQSPPSLASPEEIAEAKRRFEICKTCENARDGGFVCTLHPGCCFGKWRGKPQNHCPIDAW